MQVHFRLVFIIKAITMIPDHKGAVRSGSISFRNYATKVHKQTSKRVDWLKSLKQFFISVPYHILVASLTLMALS